MSNFHRPDQLARLLGYQGAHPSAGNQAEVDKLATGTNRDAKRSRTTSNGSDEIFRSKSWPKFLIINGTDEKFTKLSAITICITLEKLVGQIENTNRLRYGSLLVQTNTRNQTETLLHLKTFAGAPVKVEPHKTLNTCRGTVLSHESHLCSDAELKDWMSRRDVVNIRRIKLRREDSELLILTFNGNYLPDKIPVGFEWCKVRIYVPNPQRCFRCQKYGHINHNCSSQERCANSASTNHVHTRETPCQQTPICVNCDQNHAAFDRRCPKWILEKEVQRIKTTQNISFPQARRIAEQTKGPVTYAAVTSISPKPRSSPRPRINLDPNYKYSKTQHLASEARESPSNDHFDILNEFIQKKSTIQGAMPLLDPLSQRIDITQNCELEPDTMDQAMETGTPVSNSPPKVKKFQSQSRSEQEAAQPNLRKGSQKEEKTPKSSTSTKQSKSSSEKVQTKNSQNSSRIERNFKLSR